MIRTGFGDIKATIVREPLVKRLGLIRNTSVSRDVPNGGSLTRTAITRYTMSTQK